MMINDNLINEKKKQLTINNNNNLTAKWKKLWYMKNCVLLWKMMTDILSVTDGDVIPLCNEYCVGVIFWPLKMEENDEESNY